MGVTVGTRDSVEPPPRPGRFRQHIPLPPGARVGPTAPWYDLAAKKMRYDTADVRDAFADLGPAAPSPREVVPDRPGAAVLAAIYDDGGEAWVILTRRTIDLRAHSGEVSFPGGRQEPGETLEQTARRETIEEIALAENIRFVGELDHLSTVTSGSVIIPYVGVLEAPPVGLVPNPGEVDAILHVPLSRLLSPEVFRSEIWPMPDGTEYPVFFFDLDEDTVWGATAAMLRQLLGFLTGTVRRGELGHN
jgi:8-oxo-dGTP pyrophosphatase MutT (NUDIX family)